MNIVQRWKAPTPKFWKKVQKLGLAIGAIGTALVAAPVALPVAVVSTASYMILAGTITAGLSQLTVKDHD